MTTTATEPVLSENWSATQPEGTPGRVTLASSEAPAVSTAHGVVWVQARDGYWFRALSPATSASFVPQWAIERAAEEAAAIHAALLPYAEKERRERLTRIAHSDHEDLT